MGERAREDTRFEGLAREPRKVGWVWLVYLVLYAVTIPWYWPAGYRGPLIVGLPLWVVVSLLGVLLLAGFSAWVIFRYWQEDEKGEGA